MDEAEKALDHYDATVEKFLDGTVADNQADKTSAAPVTPAAFEAIRNAADPVVDSVDALKEVFDKEKVRLKAIVNEQMETWQQRFDDCLWWLALIAFVACLMWWIIGIGQDFIDNEARGAVAAAEAAAGGSSVAEGPPTPSGAVTIEDEL